MRILAPLETLDYFDSQTVSLAREISPLQAWNLITEDPQPLLKIAFKVRDAVSRKFGVKSIGGFSGTSTDTVSGGDYLDFFLVEHSDDDTLVLTERDRHLDVMTCVSSQGNEISITSSVTVHNLFGTAYMIPVGIAHKVIVRNMLRRLQRKLSL
ncbi:DUF2867 domain-containing protein [Sagittula sp. NFXS13]|uniref:DUF2867 domain-containing protein n=1 Tax=Sagittula sp. NFXS13 TaxID=2819095 RepID=UPI0032DEF733